MRRTTEKFVELFAKKLYCMAHVADPHDTPDIGGLKHDCWTQPGHSGAPLDRETDRTLAYPHSLRDDRTAGRSGMPAVVMNPFPLQYTDGAQQDDTPTSSALEEDDEEDIKLQANSKVQTPGDSSKTVRMN
ncbi:hypothetical protein MMC19_000130 [Ptychographa xylographoides]|nr:hypothetical protein [Ptychographa xylographoides]